MNVKTRIANLERKKQTINPTEIFPQGRPAHDAGNILNQLAELGVIPFEVTEDSIQALYAMRGIEL